MRERRKKKVIKFRLSEKLFYRANPIMWDVPVDEEGNPLHFRISIKEGKRFNAGRGNCISLDKETIKRYLNDIENILYVSNNHYPNDDTEYLDQLSDPRPGGRLVYSKRLSGDDRFCYIIHPFEKLKNGDIILPIDVYSCNGHTRPDGGIYYSPDYFEMKSIKKEINQWRRKRGLPEV